MLSVPLTEPIGDGDAIVVIDSSDVPVTSNDIVGIIVGVVNDDPDDVGAAELDTDTLVERVNDSPADEVLLTIAEEELVINKLAVGECVGVFEFVDEALMEGDRVPVLVALVLPVELIEILVVIEPHELSVATGVFDTDADDEIELLPLIDSLGMAVCDTSAVADIVSLVRALPVIVAEPESV
jgi:hypothetical protein